MIKVNKIVYKVSTIIKKQQEKNNNKKTQKQFDSPAHIITADGHKRPRTSDSYFINLNQTNWAN